MDRIGNPSDAATLRLVEVVGRESPACFIFPMLDLSGRMKDKCDVQTEVVQIPAMS